ncbi:MAG: DUF5522 domain-containing protein [Fluviicola sp.]
MKKKKSIPKVVDKYDYYIDENGRIIFTSNFLKKRGYCCTKGCLHCPYPKPLLS